MSISFILIHQKLMVLNNLSKQWWLVQSACYRNCVFLQKIWEKKKQHFVHVIVASMFLTVYCCISSNKQDFSYNFLFFHVLLSFYALSLHLLLSNCYGRQTRCPIGNRWLSGNLPTRATPGIDFICRPHTEVIYDTYK